MSLDAESTAGARIEIRPPQRLKAAAVVVLYGLGMLSLLPVLAAILVVSVVPHGVGVLVVVVAIGFAFVFPPLCFENPYITRVVRRMVESEDAAKDGFVVQLKVLPRLSHGLRAEVEDADDFGYLCFSGEDLVYCGDSVRLKVPVAQIATVETRNIGWRGLYLYGCRTVVVVPGLKGAQHLEFTERSSWLLPTLRKMAQRLYESLRRRAAKG